MNAISMLRQRGGVAAGSAVGVGMVMTYNLLSATKEVISGSLVQTVDPIALTALVFTIVLVVFQCLAIARGNAVYTRPFSHAGMLLLLNLFTCGAWIGFFYSVAFLEPAVVSALMVGLGPALATMLVPAWYGGSARKPEILGAAGILISTSYIAYVAATGNSSMGSLSAHDLLHGGLSALLGSVAMVGASIYSKRLSNAGARPVAIMAHRFYLLVAVAFGIALLTQTELATLAPYGAMILSLSVLGVVVPLWALQVGIKYLQPVYVTILISTAPTFTYTIQLLDSRLEVRPEIFVGVVALCLSAILSQVTWVRRKPRPQSADERE
jgi:drug/metabolite transporter (DMT)-like permease